MIYPRSDRFGLGPKKSLVVVLYGLELFFEQLDLGLSASSALAAASECVITICCCLADAGTVAFCAIVPKEVLTKK
jgi:hypothetical protein